MLLNNLLPIEEYQKTRSHIFPSIASINWFLRIHREALINADALSWPTRKLMINEMAFDQAVLAIGQKAVQR